MKYRGLVLVGVLAVLIAAASAPMAGQAPRAGASGFTPAKTAWGDPDIQGYWSGTEAGLPLERPGKFAGREFKTAEEVAAEEKRMRARDAERLAGTAVEFGFRQQPNFPAVFQGTPTENENFEVSKRTSAIIDPPDGLLPAWTPEQVKWYETLEAAKKDLGETYAPEERSVSERCFSSFSPGQVPSWGLGPRARNDLKGEGTAAQAFVAGLEAADRRTDVGQVTGGTGASGGGGRRILQTPGYVAMLFGAGNTSWKVIPLDKRPPLPLEIRQWNGSSRGYFDGNTLVVETRNVISNGPVIPTYDVGLYPGSGETLTVTERYTPISANRIEYRYTVNDPKVYVRPYTVLLTLGRNDSFVAEPAQCHEKNNMPNTLAHAQADQSLSDEYAEESRVMRQEMLAKLKSDWAKRGR